MTSNAPMPTTGARPGTVAPAESEPTIGRLVADASRDISSLIQNEIALAKAEVKVSVKAGGFAAAFFGAAAFLLLMSVIMLSVAFAYLIHLTDLDLAWCFLIVWLGYTLLAAVAGFLGYLKVRKVRPPRRAIAQAQETRTLLSRR